MNVLCNDPEIFYIDNFLTHDECNLIIKLSQDNMKPASVSYLDKDKDKYSTNIYKGRTNSSYWLPHDHHPVLNDIVQRISSKLDCNSKCFESFQIIHYKLNEHYAFHYDAYNINHKEKYDKFCKNNGNRIYTVLTYLNDVEEGGATAFDKLPEYLEVQPKKGRMVVFKNINDDGSLNLKSRHAGLPVIKGEKWAFNLWLREK